MVVVVVVVVVVYMWLWSVHVVMLVVYKCGGRQFARKPAFGGLSCSGAYHSQNWLQGPHLGGEPAVGNKTPLAMETPACPVA